ncbi:MAG: GNAT family N-acetyltransferase [Pseudothermotoga sp.]
MERFKESFKTIGKVYAMYLQGEIVGFLWIEKRDHVLHIHALIMEEQFQGRRLGKRILNLIQDEYSLWDPEHSNEESIFQMIMRSNYMKALVLRKLSS